MAHEARNKGRAACLRHGNICPGTLQTQGENKCSVGTRDWAAHGLGVGCLKLEIKAYVLFSAPHACDPFQRSPASCLEIDGPGLGLGGELQVVWKNHRALEKHRPLTMGRRTLESNEASVWLRQGTTPSCEPRPVSLTKAMCYQAVGRALEKSTFKAAATKAGKPLHGDGRPLPASH